MIMITERPEMRGKDSNIHECDYAIQVYSDFILCWKKLYCFLPRKQSKSMRYVVFADGIMQNLKYCLYSKTPKISAVRTLSIEPLHF